MKWTCTLTFPLILVSCSAILQNQLASIDLSPQGNIPNTPPEYYEQQGYRIEIRIESDGGRRGVCVFLDGSECDKWAYYFNDVLLPE
jgi:putative hemolysin